MSSQNLVRVVGALGERSGGGGSTIWPKLWRAGRTVTCWDWKENTLSGGIGMHKILYLGHHRKYLLILVGTKNLGKKAKVHMINRLILSDYN